MKQLLFFFAVLSLVYSCSSGTAPNKKLVYVQPSIEISNSADSIPNWGLTQGNSTEFFTEAVDSMIFIPLETNDEVLLGSVSSVHVIGDKLLVADANKAKQIFVFDLQGKFLYTLGGVGEGPGEYTSLNQLSVSPDGNIHILDWLKWKFITYHIDGTLLYEHRFEKKMAESVLKLNDSLFVGSYAGYFESSPFHVAWTDVNDSCINTALPIRTVQSMRAGDLQYASDGTVLFYRKLCDTIYQVTDSQIIPKWRLGLYSPEEVTEFLKAGDEMDEATFKRSLYDFKKGTIVNDFRLWEGLHYWLVEHQKGPYANVSVVSKADCSSRTYIRSFFSKRQCYIPFVFRSMHEDWICTTLDDMFFDQLDKEDQNRFFSSVKSEEMANKLRNFDVENNNPIVCLFHLR